MKICGLIFDFAHTKYDLRLVNMNLWWPFLGILNCTILGMLNFLWVENEFCGYIRYKPSPKDTPHLGEPREFNGLLNILRTITYTIKSCTHLVSYLFFFFFSFSQYLFSIPRFFSSSYPVVLVSCTRQGPLFIVPAVTRFYYFSP